MDEEVVDGKLEDAKSVNVIDVTKRDDVKDVVIVPLNPKNDDAAFKTVPMEKKGEKAVIDATNPLEGLATDLNNVTESSKNDKFNLTQVVTAPLSSTMDSAMTEVPTQTIEPSMTVIATIKPSLRTKEPAVISDTVTNNGERMQLNGYINQGNNPLVFAALAGICCIFLFVWGRKRRSNATSSSSTIEGKSPNGFDVKYSKVPDEQPVTHSQENETEYYDDYEEDTFTNGRDNWDDWEDDSTQTQLNPFATVPGALRQMTLRQSSLNPFHLEQTLPPLPKKHVQLPKRFATVKDDVLLSSVESNSSSDSFEVVTDEVDAPPTSSRSAATDAEKESESDDDLFSQFGMVMKFKKSVRVPPSSAASSTALICEPGAKAAAPSMLSSLTAAEASALFAAEMDDELTGVDVADEWGEDDEWVKRI
ncbi:unnamed protein product [Peronospora belbahrii]|uniref:Uncharacterized protein n=1 Tax=Peronospora belbahrii TaxID=622444 RepID=A0AAU9LAP6_9STRA|nr:unnamed protein product [Peronospora belbahrii]CAH0518926.1 unnamed protein product [Peronospora belbahrii]